MRAGVGLVMEMKWYMGQHDGSEQQRNSCTTPPHNAPVLGRQQVLPIRRAEGRVPAPDAAGRPELVPRHVERPC